MSKDHPDASARPLLRGVSHEVAFLLALPAAIVLAVAAPTTRAFTAAAVYGASLAAMFATSALYHRIRWTSAVARRWMRRADHSAIFVLIAGTCTPFCLALDHHRTLTLALVWGGAAAGILRAVFWVYAPKWVIALPYVALGWALTPWLPGLRVTIGTWPLVLVLLGGVLYSLGAVVYGRKWPNPDPRVFGYHEIFHLLVIAAAVLHFIAVTHVSRAL